MATSAPVPIAMPRSAWARARLSLMPSPAMATAVTLLLEALTLAALSVGRTSAMTCLIPTWAATACAAVAVVIAGDHQNLRPSASSWVIASYRLSLHGVRHGDHPAAFRRRPRTSASRLGLRPSPQPPVSSLTSTSGAVHQLLVADLEVSVVDQASRPWRGRRRTTPGWGARPPWRVRARRSRGPPGTRAASAAATLASSSVRSQFPTVVTPVSARRPWMMVPVLSSTAAVSRRAQAREPPRWRSGCRARRPVRCRP